MQIIGTMDNSMDEIGEITDLRDVFTRASGPLRGGASVCFGQIFAAFRFRASIFHMNGMGKRYREYVTLKPRKFSPFNPKKRAAPGWVQPFLNSYMRGWH